MWKMGTKCACFLVSFSEKSRRIQNCHFMRYTLPDAISHDGVWNNSNLHHTLKHLHVYLAVMDYHFQDVWYMYY